jgi:RNA recognition motif-containing protein
MGKKIYVGNMSFKVGNGELEEMFAAFGKVESAQVITDRVTGRSKGFGFVEMSNDAEAQAAIDALNGKENEGRTLTVNEARPREERPHTGGGAGRGSFNRR